MSELQLRPAGEADAEEMRQVLAAAFPDNPKTDPRIMHWQYFANPFGPTLAFAITDADRIVAKWSCMAYPALLDGKPALLAKAMDAAVLPAYQGRGLIGRLAGALYDAAADHGMRATLCHPNERSVKPLQATGMRVIAGMRSHVLLTDGAWLAERSHLPAALAGAALRAARPRWRPNGHVATELPTPPAELDELWHRLAYKVGSGVARDGAWFDWRYARYPVPGTYRYFAAYRGGELTAVAVSRVAEKYGGRFTYLMELLALDDDAAGAVVAEAAQAGRDTCGIVLAAVPGTRLSLQARAAGLRLVPSRLEPKPLDIGLVDNRGDWPQLFAGPWSFGWGDLDHL